MNITSKYCLGQRVFTGNCAWSSVPKTCEHCKGSGMVKVVTVLDSYEVPCPYCEMDLWGGKSRGYTNEWNFFVSVQSLTIGEVRIEVSATKHEVEYMCEETGVGSGTLHQEGNLFETYEEAKAHGEKMAAEAKLRREEESKKKAKSKTTRVNKKKGA